MIYVEAFQQLLLLIGRWLRWLLFAALFAFFLKAFELSFRPDWVHFVTGIALWFLLETGYYWIAIKALSRSEIPLFPHFEINQDGDEWPADERLIEVRDWLRQQQFTRLCALKAELFEASVLRASIYESADQLTRVQVLFIPKRKGGATACYRKGIPLRSPMLGNSTDSTAVPNSSQSLLVVVVSNIGINL